MDDNAIVELYLSRNEEAIDRTSEKYGVQLRNIANNILNDIETAKECENDAYLETWNLIPPHEPRNYLFAFIGKIIRHISINECIKNRRQKRYALFCELTKEMEECIPSNSNTEKDAELSELSGIINRFLSGCTEEQQNVFVRRYWYFDSVEQIAAAYGFSKSKVKTMSFRMRSGLKEYLEQGGYGA